VQPIATGVCFLKSQISIVDVVLQVSFARLKREQYDWDWKLAWKLRLEIRIRDSRQLQKACGAVSFGGVIREIIQTRPYLAGPILNVSGQRSGTVSWVLSDFHYPRKKERKSLCSTFERKGKESAFPGILGCSFTCLISPKRSAKVLINLFTRGHITRHPPRAPASLRKQSNLIQVVPSKLLVSSRMHCFYWVIYCQPIVAL